jgi:hypothetical protein
MSHLYHKTKTLADALARCSETNAAWRTKLLSYIEPLLPQLRPADRRLLKAILGLRAYAGPIRASDLAARKQFGLICAKLIDAYAATVPGLRWFHITLLADEAQTLERKPGLALKRLKAKAYKELQKLDLEGLLWIDVDALSNYPQGGEGGTFLFHVHAVAFTDKQFDLAAARQVLKRSRAWSCSMGAVPTTITEITERLGTPGWWAQYDAKPPYRAKSRRLLTDGSVELRWTKKNYRGHVALRLTEGQAQIALFDTFFAIGEGKDLREDIRKRMAAWHRTRWPDQRRPNLGDISSLFQRLWQSSNVRSYTSAWSIIGASV